MVERVSIWRRALNASVCQDSKVNFAKFKMNVWNLHAETEPLVLIFTTATDVNVHKDSLVSVAKPTTIPQRAALALL